MTKHRLLSLWLATITVGVGYLAARDTAPVVAATPGKRLVLEELDVQRINLLEPDGKPRVILTNGARFPGAVLRGKEYPHPGRGDGQGGGLLFFNDEGSEAGGLIYTSHKDAHGVANAAVLTFDQYEQNEAMKLDYDAHNGKRRAGLTVAGDHPDASLLPLFQRYEQITKIKDPAARKAAEQQLEPGEQAILGAQATRVFVGKDGDDAQLVLGDRAGKPRLVLKVDASGEPTVELLDATGKVTRRIAAK